MTSLWKSNDKNNSVPSRLEPYQNPKSINDILGSTENTTDNVILQG